MVSAWQTYFFSANWAQLAGIRSQNTATPYIPDQWHRDADTSARPMWSARWGFGLVTVNQSLARDHFTEEENSARLLGSDPALILLGGDDGLPRGARNDAFRELLPFVPREALVSQGKIRNDVWVGKLTSDSQSSWSVHDGFLRADGDFGPDLLRSEMNWREVNPGREPPATWPGDASPMSYDEWVACQESIIDKMDFTEVLPDPSFCADPPPFCHGDMSYPGCHPQAMWKDENMWSPRRGHGVVVADGEIVVMGGQAREYARIDDSRLVGGLGSQHRVETMRGHSTIREVLALKNDVWSSRDGLNWTLVNPGCRDPQQDILLKTEVWAREDAGPEFPEHVGSMSSKCHRSSECYGVAVCRALGNTPEKVCVCPMFGPRTNHAVTVQQRFARQADGSVVSQDVIYVVGGTVTVKQAFCANRSCGPEDGYPLAVDDAWMSTDGGETWLQIRPALGSSDGFRGRGGHSILVVHDYFNIDNSTGAEDQLDRLFVLAGESFGPLETSTVYLNDVWSVDLGQVGAGVDFELPSNSLTCGFRNPQLPQKPCEGGTCSSSVSGWTRVTANAPWPPRSGQAVVYEPPSASNLFARKVYLTGGEDSGGTHSDVWSWDLVGGWRCDFCRSSPDDEASRLDQFLGARSLLSEVRTFRLPEGTSEFKNYSSSPIVSDRGVAAMAEENITTVEDLASADLYTVLKLRGFDFPGRTAREVANLCLLREVALAIVDKCRLAASPEPRFHDNVDAHESAQREGDPPSRPLCGRGGETEPCVLGEWDGCTPIDDISKVDVNGLGFVQVPGTLPNVSSAMGEIHCRQEPRGRAFGGMAYIESNVLLMGGISDRRELHRDVWSRDDVAPHAIIATMPSSRSSQSIFSFDSNEAGSNVFEWKLRNDDLTDLTPWKVTTKSRPIDVSWLDNKKGGPGRGWYTMFTRAVDPAGNKDALFSTQTNVYHWLYVPPT